ncbi:VPLPA-CTERM sorting domain-containing protein [Tropicibacter sp. S64]|uniref:VPLPA-CTERM sorting domain-containing protein n=1 Tax=Tropicibacter sp. S64 TaxID=3415122 RepID=UPI003C7D83F4
MLRFVAAALFAAFAVPASAAIVTPTTATTSTNFSFTYRGANTINGSGLSTVGDPAATHAPYSSTTNGNHWTTANGDVASAWIRWGFSSLVDFGGLYIWNHQSTFPGLADNGGYEPITFDLSVSDDTTTLASWSGLSLAPDTNLSQAFSLTTPISGVRFVTFTVVETQNPFTPYTGLAEVLISDTAIAGATALSPVPLPASGLLLLAALGGAGLARRRRT